MKKITLILLLILPIVCIAQGPWEFTNTDDGWVKGGGCTSTIGSTTWTLTTNGGNNPNFTNELAGVNADANPIAAVTLKLSSGAPTLMRLRIPKDNGNFIYKTVILDPSETGFVTYYIDATDDEWSGIENNIRFQFKNENGTSGGANYATTGETIEIDKVEFLAQIPVGPKPERLIYEFNTNGDTEAWSPINSSLSIAGGLLTLVPEVDTAAKMVQLDFSVEAEESDFMHIVYKNESALNNQVRIQFRYPADGYTSFVGTNANISQSMTEFETLSINLAISRPDEWVGFVQDFQIVIRDTDNDDVTNNGASAGNFIIDRIEFNKEPSLTVNNSVFNNLAIYPNPAKEVLNIKGLKNNLMYVAVYDINGRNISKITNITDTIDTSFLSTGTYVLKIVDNLGNMIVKKLIVE